MYISPITALAMCKTWGLFLKYEESLLMEFVQRSGSLKLCVFCYGLRQPRIRILVGEVGFLFSIPVQPTGPGSQLVPCTDGTGAWGKVAMAW
jgi:hypothetical protein